MFERIKYALSDDGFKRGISGFETLVAKLLAMGMIAVILVAMFDLSLLLIQDVLLAPRLFFNTALLEVFGFFLTVLIALELLQNITAYLRKHYVQLELVIVTSLTAVARKIILLDLKSVSGVQLLGLSVAVLTLSLSYWIVRSSSAKD